MVELSPAPRCCGVLGRAKQNLILSRVLDDEAKASDPFPAHRLPALYSREGARQSQESLER